MSSTLPENKSGQSDSSDKLNHYKLIRFICISASKLKLNDIALATACTIYHKFYKFNKFNDFDPYLVATSCIFLSIKVEEQDSIQLRDIINVCYRTRHPELEPLELDEKYWSLRNSVTQTELYIVRVLGFKLEFNHPHKYLLQYLDSLYAWLDEQNSPIGEISWQILRDLLHSDILAKYRPQEIAISIIYFLMNCYGIQVPYNESAKVVWWKALDDKISFDMIYDITSEIMSIYEYENMISDKLVL